VAVVAVIWLGVAPVAYGLNGGVGMATAGLAAAAALVASQFALAASRMFRGPQAPMFGMLAGMVIRMTIALAALMLLRVNAAPMAGAALVLYLLLFYLATLATETVLLVAGIQPPAAARKTA